MKVMVMVKASEGSEAGKMPSEELMAAMGKFNEDLVKAGIMESGDGLKPSKEGYRVRFSGKERVVTTGPFAETNELVAGYWIWNVDSMEQALEWVKRCPNPMMEEDSDIEIRPFFELEDFAEVDTTGEFREKEKGLRQQLAMQDAKINNYLFFYGQCDEALEFYKQHLSIQVDSLFRFSDSPEPMPEGVLPEGFENKVMHCEFSLGNTKIFASDGCAPDSPRTSTGFALAITLDDEEEIRRMFDALAEGGEVIMPLERTFWSPLYGQVTDKFGITWMLMIPGEEN